MGAGGGCIDPCGKTRHASLSRWEPAPRFVLCDKRSQHRCRHAARRRSVNALGFRHAQVRSLELVNTFPSKKDQKSEQNHSGDIRAHVDTTTDRWARLIEFG